MLRISQCVYLLQKIHHHSLDVSLSNLSSLTKLSNSTRIYNLFMAWMKKTIRTIRRLNKCNDASVWIMDSSSLIYWWKQSNRSYHRKVFLLIKLSHIGYSIWGNTQLSLQKSEREWNEYNELLFRKNRSRSQKIFKSPKSINSRCCKMYQSGYAFIYWQCVLPYNF